MEIYSKITRISGETMEVIYKEEDPLLDLDEAALQGVHAYCFVKSADPLKNGKMVLVNHPKAGWTPPGGGIDDGETYEEAVSREVKEETNMKVLEQHFIGYQDIFEEERTIRQVRSFCIVEPYGEFTGDPDGEIQEIQLIAPDAYKRYFDWGAIGDRIMERAVELADEKLEI